MLRWEPWVRRQVVGFELLSRLKFASDGTITDAFGTLSSGSDKIITIHRTTPELIGKNQLSQVFSYADLRRDRASEINSQLTDFFPFFATICHLHPDRSPFTLELLTALRRVVVPTQMRIKHALAMPRPVDYSAQIMPVIQTPGHSSFPAGHAVKSFMFATVLAELTAKREEQLYGSDRPLRDQLRWLAARISVNRVVAGVHFPVDLAAGMVLGTLLGKYFVALTKETTQSKKEESEKEESFLPWTFNAKNYGKDDFRWREMLTVIDDNQEQLSPELGGYPFLTRGDGFTPTPFAPKTRCAGYGIARPGMGVSRGDVRWKATGVSAREALLPKTIWT